MATVTGDRAARGDALDRGRRVSSETKHSSKTSELYVMVAAVAGVLIAAAVVDGFEAGRAWTLVAAIAIGYMISRGLAKAGSRDPYWDEGGDRSASR
jgi:hypothetical protein